MSPNAEFLESMGILFYLTTEASHSILPYLLTKLQHALNNEFFLDMMHIYELKENVLVSSLKIVIKPNINCNTLN